jgi:hypothetical protein
MGIAGAARGLSSGFAMETGKTCFGWCIGIKRILAHFLRFGQTCKQRNGLSKQADQIKT